MAKIAVVGAANVDIGGFSREKIVAGDSNPGKGRLSLGGVGRNIAANAAKLGLTTELVTALGTDAFARMIRQDCEEAGISLQHAAEIPGENSSVYLFVADDDGDMTAAVNDMALYEHMTPERLEVVIPALNQQDLVVLDANLPESTLTWLAETLTVPLMADAVSAAKVERLRWALCKLDAFKPNRIEAEKLTGIAVTDAQSAERAARTIADMGVKQVYLSLGTRGGCCADSERSVFMPGAVLPMKNATGAGDAFTAALAWARTQEYTMELSALAGMAAASIAVESAETVSPVLTEPFLVRRMHEIDEKTGGRRYE